ncbi:protein TALPID3 [Carettochelys insculpta]|uniref:protein TALPID3 n=1 Tax=Carettochelys insculpta TaxID=44489 RepID=UPI003EB8CCFD
MEVESNSSVSQDSMASFDAGNVLIRSTSLHTKEQPTGIWTAATNCCKKKVKISVKKLREVASPYQTDADDAALNKDKTSYIPPALPANKSQLNKSTITASSNIIQAVRNTLAERSSEHLLSLDNDMEPTLLSEEEASRKGVPLQVVEGGNKPEDCDIFISQYAAGEREALRAVLKQRTQNPPVFKEVKVQLLDNVSTEKKESAQDTRSAHSDIDPATTIAAATAAAIATTAPLLKVQSDLEAKVSSVSALLSKLQETDKQLQHVTEQQTNIKTQQYERSHCHDRVSELEKQMNVFMEQRIQHLEKLQQQQMDIQSRLISSAINTGGFQPVNVPSSNVMAKQSIKPELQQPLTNQDSSCHRNLFSTKALPNRAYSSQFGNYGARTPKSPLKTPAPRRYAPVPVSKDVKISQKISKKERPIAEKENVPKSAYGSTEGGGRLLEQILNSQETSLTQMDSSQKMTVNNTKIAWHSDREGPATLQADTIPAFEGPLQDFNSVNKTVKKAEDVLQDLGQLKKEMHGMLQEAKAWKSDMNDFVKPTNPVVTPSLGEYHQVSKPSILQTVKAPKSMFKDAERILRNVQNNKKVLEENLEAIIRAKNGDAMYTFINALTANRDVLEEIRIRRTVDEWIKAISMEIQAEMAKTDNEPTQYNQKDKNTSWIKKTQNAKDMKTKKELKAKTPKPQGSITKKYLSAAKPSQKQTEDNLRQNLRSYSVSGTLLEKEGRAKGPLKARAVVQNEEYLSQVYGKPVYQGHRSTLKKTPYLRFNSPSPKSKPQRPKVIERVRGTKVKSTRTQTSFYAHQVITSPKRQLPHSAPLKESQFLFSPVREVPEVSGPLEGHLIPMAIPLGQTHINSILPQPSGVTIGKPHPVTVTTSVLPVPPKPQSKVKKPNIAVIEMRSEKKDPPKLTIQVLPNVDIDSISNDSVSVNHSSANSEAVLLPVSSLIQGPEQTLYEEEDIKFPGTNFVDVTDVIQDQVAEEDEIPELSEPFLEFNRQTEVVSPKYNGPPFPPAAPASQQPADTLEEIIERRETLENRLISWVEQEVMARVISGMYPIQKETVPNVSASDSEESAAVTSDIVEAAGGGGFQLFVSAGVPVNSEMISHFVNEALTEAVAIMLGDREAQKAGPGENVLQSTTVLPESVVSTPLATPPHTPPPEKELPSVKTPVSSPSVTDISGDVCEQEQMTEKGLEIPAAASPIGTPAATPVDTPPRVTTPTPPVSEHGSDATQMGSPKPPNPWGDAELPLDEEKLSPLNEETLYPRAIVMSVAKDEEPEMLISPVSPEPIKSLICEPRVPSPVNTPSSGPSSHESSLTVTQTETADRPISEGEVLFSYGQLVAARALAEGGLSLPNLNESLTSTLHDANEMDFDPPSEGQVMRKPHRGYHRHPVLSLYANLSQAPVVSQEVIYHSEDSDNSVGELSEGQRPRLTIAAESILMGHSVYMDQPSGLVTEQRPHRVPSPGECDRVTAELLGDAADVSHGPMSVAELESQPLSNAVPQTAQANDRPRSISEDLPEKQSPKVVQVKPVRSRVIRVRNKSEVAQQQDSQGDMDRTHIEPSVYLTSLLKGEETVPHISSLTSPAKMSVMLPSTNIDDQTQKRQSYSVCILKWKVEASKVSV